MKKLVSKRKSIKIKVWEVDVVWKFYSVYGIFKYEIKYKW